MKTSKIILAAFLATFASLSAKETLEQRVAKLEADSKKHETALKKIETTQLNNGKKDEKLSPAASNDSEQNLDGVSDMFAEEEKKAEEEKRAADKKRADDASIAKKVFERAKKKQKQEVANAEDANVEGVSGLFSESDARYKKAEADRKKKADRLSKKQEVAKAEDANVEGVSDMLNDSDARYKKAEKKRKKIEQLQKELNDINVTDGYIKSK